MHTLAPHLLFLYAKTGRLGAAGFDSFSDFSLLPHLRRDGALERRHHLLLARHDAREEE